MQLSAWRRPATASAFVDAPEMFDAPVDIGGVPGVLAT
jgi:hypothetical protein